MKRTRTFLGDVEHALDVAGRYLGRVGTLGKLAQAAPVVLGLLVVFFSPSAWLSGTLRTWAFAGVAVGAVVGALAVALGAVRSAYKQGLVFVMLVTFVVGAAALRLHLAIADVRFVERWMVLQPLHDLYLGSDAGELAFDAVTSLGFAVVVAAATVGLPVFVVWLRQRRDEAAKRRGGGRDLAATLAEVTRGVQRLEERIAELGAENRRLERELAAARSELERVRAAPSTGERAEANETG